MVDLEKIDGDVMQDFSIWISGREEDIANGTEDFYQLQEFFEQLIGRKAGEKQEDTEMIF
jgi:hypothetical protein